MKSFSIAEVVPHSGVMSLLDEVIEYDNDSLSAQVVVTEESLFATPHGVPSWVGLEYMAQAIGAYSGVMACLVGKDVSVGFLVGTRKYTCNHAFFPIGTTLRVSIVEELQGDNGLGVFQCKISVINNDIVSNMDIEASANLSVFQPENLDEFLKA
ncbi:MAG: hypothetical protein DRQ54_08290 [Gammaproteobacteria bacterium]|nr:MAG: hypothetical protein DRQ54_08290 [Gammaproteobacteria bacterium]